MNESLQLSFLLTRQLATDESAALSVNAELALELLQFHRLVARVQDEADGLAVSRRDVGSSKSAPSSEKASNLLHRWNLRIASLVNSKSTSAQSTGFILALETASQSQNIFLQNSKVWYNTALALLGRKAVAAGSAVVPAIDVLLYCFSRAASFNEYARDVANPGGVRKFGESLLAITDNEAVDVATRQHCLHALHDLIHVNASPLRPIASQLQALSTKLMCAWSDRIDLLGPRNSAIRLLTSVYATAGKASASQSWQRTVESLCGSAHQLLNPLLSTVVEDVPQSGVLSVIELPPLRPHRYNSLDGSEMLTIYSQRLDCILEALQSMLSNPTERPVNVPIGHLTRLGRRLLSATAHSPSRDRHDETLHMLQVASLPRLHIWACKLLGQLVQCCGDYLASSSTLLIENIHQTIISYDTGAPARTALYALAALIVQGIPTHPDHTATTLSKIVRNLLADVAKTLKGSPARSTVHHKNDESSRKAKKSRLFETDQALSPKITISSDDATLVNHALRSLHTFLSFSACLLQPDTLNLTLRLLLSFSLSPMFFVIALPASPSHTPLLQAIVLEPELRLRLVECLTAASYSSGRDSAGYLDRAALVFQHGLRCASDDVRSACSRGLAVIDLAIHPSFPPLLRSAAAQVKIDESAGGSVQRMVPSASQEYDGEAGFTTLRLQDDEAMQYGGSSLHLPSAQPSAPPAASTPVAITADVSRRTTYGKEMTGSSEPSIATTTISHVRPRPTGLSAEEVVEMAPSLPASVQSTDSPSRMDVSSHKDDFAAFQEKPEQSRNDLPLGHSLPNASTFPEATFPSSIPVPATRQLTRAADGNESDSSGSDAPIPKIYTGDTDEEDEDSEEDDENVDADSNIRID